MASFSAEAGVVLTGIRKHSRVAAAPCSLKSCGELNENPDQ